jgi:hypothetical protein
MKRKIKISHQGTLARSRAAKTVFKFYVRPMEINIPNPTER